MLNHIVVMGRLTHDPELRKTASGVSVASFSVAVDRDFSQQDGKKETDFLDVVAWRNTAEFAAKYFTKGRMAVVSGRLQIRNWEDKEGNKRRTAEILAENIYFGKPCGLMDQAACAIGGLIKIDFKDPKKPLIKKQMIKFEQFNHSLCIVDTKDVPANLTKEYRAIIEEMRSVAKYFGKEFLREVDENEFYEHIIPMRKVCSDRAILRAMHFYSEEKRVNKELKALRDGNFHEFKIQIRRSGNSSFEYLQNVYSSKDPSHQNISLAICMSEKILKDKGVVRVHGPGFEGTIQVFVENDYARKYKNEIEKYMGKHCCYVTHIRQQGAMKVI